MNAILVIISQPIDIAYMNAIIVNQVILMSRIPVTENLKQFKFQAHNNQIEGFALASAACSTLLVAFWMA